MARRPKREYVDNLARQWASIRRQLLGLDDPKARLASDTLGAVRSTLGQRRDLHAGARTNRVEQHWPEVYVGDALMVNQAFHAMTPRMQSFMDVHYVYPGDVDDKAPALCVSRETYFEEIREIRAWIEAWFAARRAD